MPNFNGQNQDSAFFGATAQGSLANSNVMPLQYAGIVREVAPVSVAAQDSIISRLIADANSAGKQLFRGTDNFTGQYVYSIGSPPSGASNIIVVNTGESSY